MTESRTRTHIRGRAQTKETMWSSRDYGRATAATTRTKNEYTNNIQYDTLYYYVYGRIIWFTYKATQPHDATRNEPRTYEVRIEQRVYKDIVCDGAGSGVKERGHTAAGADGFCAATRHNRSSYPRPAATHQRRRRWFFFFFYDWRSELCRPVYTNTSEPCVRHYRLCSIGRPAVKGSRPPAHAAVQRRRRIVFV